MTTPNVKLLRDLVMIKPRPLTLNKTADGIILPGDVDKMSPKRATVIAAGPGTYDKTGKMIANKIKEGDQILYMERNLAPVKINGEDYFILQQEDVILKIGKEEPDPLTSLPEMSNSEYLAETLRRALINHLTEACGLVRVQDMINPVEMYDALDGSEKVPAKAQSFLLADEESIRTFTPPDGIKAFAMYQLNYMEFGGLEIDPVTYLPTGVDHPKETRIIVRLAFLSRSDVTLG